MPPGILHIAPAILHLPANPKLLPVRLPVLLRVLPLRQAEEVFPELPQLLLHRSLGPGRVFLSFDGGPWEYKGDFRGNRTRSLTLPVWPRRCDRLRLRLEGRGGMELEQLSFLVEAGSDE